MLRQRCHGSFTVEAAFVLPLILFIIFAFLYLGFDLHDSVCIRTIIDKYAMRGQDDLRLFEAKEIETRLEQEIMEEANNKLCITKLENMKIHVGILSIHIEYCERRKLNLPGIQTLLGSETQLREKDILIYDPMKSIRSLGGLLKDDS